MTGCLRRWSIAALPVSVILDPEVKPALEC